MLLYTSYYIRSTTRRHRRPEAIETFSARRRQSYWAIHRNKFTSISISCTCVLRIDWAEKHKSAEKNARRSEKKKKKSEKKLFIRHWNPCLEFRTAFGPTPELLLLLLSSSFTSSFIPAIGVNLYLFKFESHCYVYPSARLFVRNVCWRFSANPRRRLCINLI